MMPVDSASILDQTIDGSMFGDVVSEAPGLSSRSTRGRQPRTSSPLNHGRNPPVNRELLDKTIATDYASPERNSK